MRGDSVGERGLCCGGGGGGISLILTIEIHQILKEDNYHLILSLALNSLKWLQLCIVPI